MSKAKSHAEFVRWMGPLLDALRALGGSASPRECSNWIAEKLQLPESVTASRTPSGSERFHMNVQWARQYLIFEGLLESPRRGVWTITSKGAERRLSVQDGQAIFTKWAKIHAERRKKAADIIPKEEGSTEVMPETEEEENELLEVLQSLPPAGFERLCMRVLHEYGLERVIVTGKSHDGGIDGIGVLRLNPFVTMKVSVQCKRIRSSVSRAQVGDFRNAVMGRADKGILITTGWFSSDAEKEANREGVIQLNWSMASGWWNCLKQS